MNASSEHHVHLHMHEDGVFHAHAHRHVREDSQSCAGGETDFDHVHDHLGQGIAGVDTSAPVRGDLSTDALTGGIDTAGCDAARPAVPETPGADERSPRPGRLG